MKSRQDVLIVMIIIVVYVCGLGLERWWESSRTERVLTKWNQRSRLATIELKPPTVPPPGECHKWNGTVHCEYPLEVHQGDFVIFVAN